jgi:hypothetical protein
MVSLQRGPASVGARDAEKNNAPFANRAGKETPDLFMFERFLLIVSGAPARASARRMGTEKHSPAARTDTGQAISGMG